MRIAIINKSDSTGGAAVVSRRLMEALRKEGVDARMIVTEKHTDSPFVVEAASEWRERIPFIEERLGIFISNGFDRETLFKIDTGSRGLPLWRHPLVREADAVFLNWVNQGMLSLSGVEKIIAAGKPVVWTMHDMWCFTGVCHHAGECERYIGECGCCPLLKGKSGENDLSRKVWSKKRRLPLSVRFVAVSNWLKERAKRSSLLRDADVRVIPNAFHIDSNDFEEALIQRKNDSIRLLFGAARLDDPVKGLPSLVEATKILRKENPQLADRIELVTFGAMKNPDSFDGLAIPVRHLGMIREEEKVKEIYKSGDILVSASEYETLPGTLVEAQAYGCIPVSFNRGGQNDIVDHKITGWLADRDEDPAVGGRNLAKGIVWAAGIAGDPNRREQMVRDMRESVVRKFSSESVAREYIRLVEEII